MDIEKLIEKANHLGMELKRDGGEFEYSIGKKFLEYATALSTLQAENKSLHVLAELGNTRAKDYRVMRDRAVKAEEENKKLRAELEQAREKNAGLALALLTECAPNPDCLGDDEWRAIRAELDRVKAERDAAIEYLREIEWCAGCKHFGGLDGCKKWAMGQCTEKNDLYEFVGPQKED